MESMIDMNEDKLREIIKEILDEIEDEIEDEEEVEESTTTGNVDGYLTPNAFSTSDEPDDDYIDRLNRSTGYKRVNEEYHNRWLELKKSDQTPNQKIGIGIRQIRRELSEMEKFVRWYSKIRKMNELGKDDYWKRTQRHLKKIKERLIGFAHKIQELDGSLDELNEGFKGAENIPKNKSFEKLSDADKLKIVQGKGNIIDFKVPRHMDRRFLQVISKGKIKKSGGSYYLPGDMIDSPDYSSVKELLDNVLWDDMEERRSFNESTIDLTNEVSANDVLGISQKYRNTKIKHWTGIEGTFAAVLVSSILKNTNVDPRKVYLSWDRRNGVLEITYKGKTKTIKRKSINADFVVDQIKKMT